MSRHFETWAEKGFTANVNRERTRPIEAAAITAAGGVRPIEIEDAAVRKRIEDASRHTQFVDPKTGRRIRGRDIGPDATKRVMETRPDGLRLRDDGKIDVLEHKHLTREPPVLNDSPQLAAERAMANKLGGRHEILISSNEKLKPGELPGARPSGPLGKSGSDVFYVEKTTGEKTHRWDRFTSEWVPLSEPSAAAARLTPQTGR